MEQKKQKKHIRIHPQFPLTIVFDESRNFTECPICLESSELIGSCVMLNCGHRLCLLCAQRLSECPLCRSVISDPTKRIAFLVKCTNRNRKDQAWINGP